MNLLAMGAILSAWSGWVFKSKSEDRNRDEASREQSAAVSKYTERLIRNAVIGGQKIGEGGGRPEGKSLFVKID